MQGPLNGTRIHPRAPETNISEREALLTRASAEDSVFARGRGTDGETRLAGARRVKCELYNSRNFGDSGRGDLSSPRSTTPWSRSSASTSPASACSTASWSQPARRRWSRPQRHLVRSCRRLERDDGRGWQGATGRARDFRRWRSSRPCWLARRCTSGQNKLNNELAFTRERREPKHMGADPESRGVHAASRSSHETASWGRAGTGCAASARPRRAT